MNIFLSFPSAEREWINLLASLLIEAGVEVSGDENGPRLGENAGQWLQRQLEAATFVVPVFTTHPSFSPRVLFTLGTAWEMGKPVMPLLIVPVGESPQRPAYLSESLDLLPVTWPGEAAEQLQKALSMRMATA